VVRNNPSEKEAEALQFDCPVCSSKSGTWCVYLPVERPAEWHHWDSIAKRYNRSRAQKRYEAIGTPTGKLHSLRFNQIYEWQKRAEVRATHEYLVDWFREYGWIFKEGPV
jgi:hypothetical protein